MVAATTVRTLGHEREEDEEREKKLFRIPRKTGVEATWRAGERKCIGGTNERK